VTEARFCDEQDWGFGWITEEKLRRTSHAVRTREGVWIFDPVRWQPALERARELGTVVGVVQLLDRHGRDSADVAAALGVANYVVPLQGVSAAGLETLPIRTGRFWKEVAAWIPEHRALVCGDALGTVAYFRARNERIGLHPLLRPRPPRSLGRYEPRHILVGHGEGIHGEDVPAALEEALRTARRRMLGAWLGVLRSG
jgi:hypothetical protein